MATFFLDNDISFRIAHALNQLVHDHKVIALRDEFPPDTKDVDWIPEVGNRGYIVVSRDANQRRRDAEREALKDNGVSVLYVRVGPSPQTLFADAARIVKNWPQIQAWGLAAKPGEMARLTTQDKIEAL